MKIQTDRLVISSPRQKDALDVYAHRTDGQATLFTGGIPNLSWPDFERKYQERCASGDEERGHVFSVILKESDRYIGYCGFQYCATLEGVEILYGYSSEYWGNGYAFEAARAVLSHGFRNLGYERIVAAVNPENPASERILRKLGMTFRGKVDWPGQGLVNKYEISSPGSERKDRKIGESAVHVAGIPGERV